MTSLVERTWRSAPEAAARWVGRIGDEVVRNYQMLRIARSWLASQRRAATEWILQGPLPDATKGALIEEAGAR